MQTEEEDGDLSSLLFSDVLNTMIRFDYVGKNGLEISENDFNKFIALQNILYTTDVPDYVVELCDLFPNYKINKETLYTLFKQENNNYADITYDFQNRPDDKWMEKSDVDISCFDIQENLTLIKYFVERYDINLKEPLYINNEEVDLFTICLFPQTARYLRESGVPMKMKNDYPDFVKKEFVEYEKELLNKNINNQSENGLKQKRL